MKRPFSFSDVWLFILGAMLLAACDQKHLVMPEEGVPVLFIKYDWEKAPDADPEGATLIFFPTDDPEKEIWRFDLAGKAGGKIELPYGTYDILAVNNDLPNIDFINQTSFSQFGAKAVADGTTLPDGEQVTFPTGMLYSVAMRNVSHSRMGISINGSPVNTDLRQTLILYPDSLSTRYELKVGPITVPPTLKKMSVWIGGTGDFMTISDGKSEGVTAVPFENLVLQEGNILTGACTGFGGSNGTTKKYDLTFRFQDDYGRTFYKRIDITGIVVNSKWNHCVYIDIGDMDFSDTIGSNTDFGNPIGVDGWENIDIDHEIYFP
ncbi:MAG: DUF5119 domain-containing protein [Muribaculaceae bacterium]|nr:DUF5119 domain-containing protein [Muribaculaceae bacterium]